MQNRKGFTLIELLIVVVIIGILAAIAIPKFASTKEKAYLASMKSDLRNLATAQEAYAADNNQNYFSGAATNPAGLPTGCAGTACLIVPSAGVTLTVTATAATGWSARRPTPARLARPARSTSAAWRRLRRRRSRASRSAPKQDQQLKRNNGRRSSGRRPFAEYLKRIATSQGQTMTRSPRHHTRSSRTGFTLIELLIVVVIIGILAAIAIPKFALHQGEVVHRRP